MNTGTDEGDPDSDPPSDRSDDDDDNCSTIEAQVELGKTVCE
jgi:hypothetical protein